MAARARYAYPAVVSLAVLVLLASLACTPVQAPSPPVGQRVPDEQAATTLRNAQKLLDLYHLKTVGAPTWGPTTLATSTEDWTPMVNASAAIGLDLAGHAGEAVERIMYTLAGTESSRNSPGSAWLLVSHGEVIGAYLKPWTPLASRTDLYPLSGAGEFRYAPIPPTPRN